jgi:radical S-adenosyl methionine domain-containing protein 2
MSSVTLPDTVNYHFTAACNMKCRFCFAGFRDCGRDALHHHKAVIREIGRAVAGSPKPCRLNFVGGEPTVYPQFPELIQEAVDSGLDVSMVTNGFMLIKYGLKEAYRMLGLVGLSVDSVNPESNLRAGRSVDGKTISASQWMQLFEQLSEMGIGIKINTTVTKYNAGEDLSAFIAEANPIRWKVFQGMVVEGQNARNQDDWVIDAAFFDGFVNRHRALGCAPVVESESVMRGSYAMISPDGRFFDSTEGEHTYSKPILDVGVERAWEQVCFDPMAYGARTASYSKGEVTHV